jgi:hypothetical protein
VAVCVAGRPFGQVAACAEAKLLPLLVTDGA